jgi:hypothetical protein
MNIYRSIAHMVGTADALALSEQLSAWHDAMVAHQRPADTLGSSECDPECPHAMAKSLWQNAIDVLGHHAARLTFLQRHGCQPARRLASEG